MQVSSVKVAELQKNEKERIQNFLRRRSQSSEAKEILRKTLNFNPAFLITLENEGELKGLVALTPAAKDPFELEVTKLPIWRLRFCAQGEIFKCLQEIAYSGLSRDYLEENCNLNLIAEILRVIEKSALQIGAVVAKHRQNDLDKNSRLLVKSLGEAANYEEVDHSYRKLKNYDAVVI